MELGPQIDSKLKKIPTSDTVPEGEEDVVDEELKELRIAIREQVRRFLKNAGIL